ncbi:hypothetical protein H0W91_00125 [Patescibacteria group bacterium]|nr:hypothetical protein [Patescibacteria group bacterium]
MKNDKFTSKYKRVKNTLWTGASTGLMAGMLLMGTGRALAADTTEYATVPYSDTQTQTTGMHMMHRWNSSKKINALATHLGLDVDKVNEEIKSGATLKQILQENGIVPGQLEKAFSVKKNGPQKKWKK